MPIAHFDFNIDGADDSLNRSRSAALDVNQTPSRSGSVRLRPLHTSTVLLAAGGSSNAASHAAPHRG